MVLDTSLEKACDRYVSSKRYPDAIQSGRETRIDDAAATPRVSGSGCYRRERWRVAVPGPERIEPRTTVLISTVLMTTWHAWRHHVDLCRTCAALCRA